MAVCWKVGDFGVNSLSNLVPLADVCTARDSYCNTTVIHRALWLLILAFSPFQLYLDITLLKTDLTMCNKKAAGIASVITGVVLVVVGIIVGLVLPNTVQKAIEEEVCVNNKESPGYKRWVSYVTYLHY